MESCAVFCTVSKHLEIPLGGSCEYQEMIASGIKLIGKQIEIQGKFSEKLNRNF